MDVQPPTTPDPHEQWLNSRLVIRAELRFDQRTIGKDIQVVIEDPVRSKFYQIGIAEYQLITALDGNHSIADIIDVERLNLQDANIEGVRSSSANHVARLNESQAVKIAQWLVQNNLAFCPTMDNSKRLDEQARQMQRAKLMGWINPISCKIPLFNPNRILTTIQPFTQWMFSGWVLLIWLAVGAYALSTLATDWDKIGPASTGIFSGSSWIWMLLIWLGLKVIHETAHGIACRRFGGEVPEAGVLLLLFTPMAYVNVTSMWRLANRWERIVVSAAGMYVELFVSFIALIVWHHGTGIASDLGFKVFMMASVTTILFNANPLMRFDGYFILSDLIDIPNLYTKGTKWFGDRFKNLFFGTPKNVNLFGRGEGKIVRIYGTLAWLWKATISLSLIIGASVLFNGAGLALAAIGVICWYGMPLWNQIKWFQTAFTNGSVNKSRMILSGGLTIAITIVFFTILKAPATKSAPALVQFSEEQILRASADSFLDEILVNNGDSVRHDQGLLVLKNDQLHFELFELTGLAEEANIEARMHRKQGELSLAQSATEKFLSLQNQLAEKQDQVDRLTIKAPFDGFVFQRQLESRIGSFVRAGDELLTIARKDTKEVIVSIDQRDLESIQGQEGQFLRVAFPGQPIFQSKLKRINPRASTNLYLPSLGANQGGPLPVKPIASDASNRESHFSLLDPRFTIDLEIESKLGRQLNAGQRGRAFFETQQQSLGSYLYIAVADWLENKIEMATQSAAF